MPFHNPDLARRAKELLNGITGELSALVTAGKPYSLDRATRAFGGLKGRVTAAVDCLTSLQLAPLAFDLGAIYCAADDELERIVRVHYDKQKPGSARLGEKRFVLPLARTDILGVHYNEDERFLFPRAPTDDAEYQELQERLWRVFIDAAIEAQRVAAELAEFLTDRLDDGNGGGQGGKKGVPMTQHIEVRDSPRAKVIVQTSGDHSSNQLNEERPKDNSLRTFFARIGKALSWIGKVKGWWPLIAGRFGRRG